MTVFVKVRQTWYPSDSIDQIDDLPGKTVVVLASGLKIVLDPIEGEKVLKQLEGSAETAREQPTEPSGALIGRMVALEAQVLALKAKLETIGSAIGTMVPQQPKAKAKTNA